MSAGKGAIRSLNAATIAALAAMVALLALAIACGVAAAAADLEVGANDIVPAVPKPTQGTTVTVNVTVHNTGDANATGFYVSLRDTTAGADIGEVGPIDCKAGSTKVARFTWSLVGASAGGHTLKAKADSRSNVSEDDETDNEATRVVTVNRPPTAVATASETTVLTLTAITFDGKSSSDEEGSIAAYLWYFGDGQVASGPNASHSYSDGSPSPGRVYNVTLVVTDADGGMDEATLQVYILNRRPTASTQGATVNTMTALTLSGAASKDPDGNISSWRWTLHNGTVLWGSTVVVVYPDDGVYTVRLLVTDDDGATDETTVSVRVINQAPFVSAKANRTLVGRGDPITFDGSASRDVDGTITNHTWIFGDSTTASGAIVSHAYAANGTYTATLVVVDDDGAVSYKGIKVIVGNSPPIAVAKASTASVLTFEEVELNATASYDPDDNIATYAWDLADGTSLDGKVVTHNWTDDGAYLVTLVVTDTGGASSSSTLTILVINRPPVAEFEDLEVLTNQSALFNGSMCSDKDGYIAEWRWDCGGGAVYTTANASHRWSMPGTYTVTLTIKDDDGAGAVTSFNVTVKNRPPRAVATATPTEVTRATPIKFDGSGSYDPDGEVVNWSWSLGDGSRVSGAVVEHTFASYGTYLVTLTVRDDRGAVNSTGILVTVRNQPPTAVANITPTSAFTGVEISFDGSASSDPENQIAEYYWSFGDGEQDTGAIVRHTYADDGRYTVRLTVMDQDGASAMVEVAVLVLNRPPVAVASADPLEAPTMSEFSFASTGSKDHDGRILWYMWEMGDGTVAYGATVRHAFADDGTYVVRLTVTDDDGSDGSAEVTVVVVNRPPVAVAPSPMETVTGAVVHLDGRASWDPDGRVVEWRWDFGDGTTGTGASVTHAFIPDGTFIVTLTVVDDDGATSSANTTVTVANVEPVARITGELAVMSGEQVVLSGESSYDLDGTIDEFRWNLGDGTTSLGLTVRHAYATVGTYTVTLEVVDDGGLQARSSVDVRVLNRPPRARATATPAIVQTSDTVSFDGGASIDTDGSIVEYTWIFGDGAIAHGKSVGHSYGMDGVFMVVLTVVDDKGGADSTSVFVQVENRPPVASITGPEEAVLTLLDIGFSGENSSDPDGKVSRWFWDFGDGRSGEGASAMHAYETPGSYNVRLTVMDDDGRMTSTTVGVEVLNRPPEAKAKSTGEGYVNATIKFECTESRDPDGLVSRWTWNFGDGATAEGREAFHEYLLPGTYAWNLTVTDDRGAATVASGSVLIREEPYVPPTTKPDDGKDQQDSPGMGSVAALAALGAIAAVGLAARGRSRRE